MSLRRPTEVFLFIYWPFEASLQTPDRCLLLLICYCIFINNLLTCIRDLFTFRDWHHEHKYFGTSLLYYTRVHNVCEYIQSTHWLVPGYCLGQISCTKRSDPWWQPRNACNGDSSLAKIGVNLVSCSRGKWSPIDTDDSQPLPPSTTRNHLLYSQARMVLYDIFCIWLEFLYQVSALSANSYLGADEYKGHFPGISTRRIGRHIF